MQATFLAAWPKFEAFFVPLDRPLKILASRTTNCSPLELRLRPVLLSGENRK